MELKVVQFNLSSGHVSAIYFVLLEFVMLAIIDIMLIHVVSSFWYRRIINGVALEVKTAEICGVANSLVGRYSAPPNLFAYAVKITLLGFILLTDINIYSRVVEITSETPITLTGTFTFEPSENSWGRQLYKAVTRPTPDISGCRITKGEQITFFRIYFNFTDNVVYEDEDADEIYQVNDSSIICSQNGSVPYSEDNVLERVEGCSDLETSICSNESILERNFNLLDLRPFPSPLPVYHHLDWYKRETAKFSVENYTKAAPEIWPEYNTGKYRNPTLACTTSTFLIEVRDNEPEKRSRESCIVTAEVGNSTLVELWQHHPNQEDPLKSKFTRLFPGPIIARRLDIGQAFKGVVLRELRDQFYSWESFSARLIAKGVIYERSIVPVTEVLGTKTVSIIPLYNLIIVGVLLLITAIVSLIVISTVAKDTKPRINTINGLSSIAREETEPTGRSLDAGKPMAIGLTKRADDAHFGPLRSNDVNIALRDVNYVV